MKSTKKESRDSSFRVWKTLIRGSICMINSPKWNSLLANEIPQIGLEPENYRLLPWYGRAASSREEGAAGLSKLAALPNEIEILSLPVFLAKETAFSHFFSRDTHTWVIIRSRSSSGICITISSPAHNLLLFTTWEGEERKGVLMEEVNF